MTNKLAYFVYAAGHNIRSRHVVSKRRARFTSLQFLSYLRDIRINRLVCGTGASLGYLGCSLESGISHSDLLRYRVSAECTYTPPCQLYQEILDEKFTAGKFACNIYILNDILYLYHVKIKRTFTISRCTGRVRYY